MVALKNTKEYIEENVFDMAYKRMEYIFDNFENVYFSFSGGKDSSVMINIALEIAKDKGKLPINVLFIDFEAQYKATIRHAEEVLLREDVNAYWICLPMNLRNAVSVYQSQWICWDEVEKDKWVREMPQHDCVINDIGYFDFFKVGMEFEEFIIEFGKWFSDGNNTACGVGIRADESLNRFRTIVNKRKETFHGNMWTTKTGENLYNFYPIYDWRTEDIWLAVGIKNWTYNRIYDLMYMQGKTIHESRLCQPYGDDQRKGLNLFRMCEPETWAKVVNRVSGSNFGNIYCNTYLMGYNKWILPTGHTWKSYANFLLETLPKWESEWYMTKFRVFFDWWEKHGFPLEDIPDEDLPKEHPRLQKSDGTFHRQSPSWKRICKCILKNDRICKSLSFAQTKNQYNKYIEMRDKYGY